VTRLPLAFRPTVEVRAALERRAEAAGVDVRDPNAFAAWAGDLIAEALPEVVADLVNPAGEP